MTEGNSGTSPSAATPASRRKSRRKRNQGKKNDSSGQQKGGKASSSKGGGKKSAAGGNNNSPPPPPQIKITIRNIQNAEKFGSVKSILESLLPKLMDSCVEKRAENKYTIEWDRGAVRHLITEEEKLEEYKEKMAREREESMEIGSKIVEESEGNSDNSGNGEGGGSGGNVLSDTSPQDIDVKEKRLDEKSKSCDRLDVLIAPKTQSNLPAVTVRPLYVVPPRKTRRRGERGGTAYVLLIAPKIKPTKTNATGTNSSVPNLEQQRNESVKADVELGSEVESKETTTGDVNSQRDASPEQNINYPQELAKGRLLLSNAVKALTEVTLADLTSQEFLFSGCIVEQSMNGKTWKMLPNSNGRPDRRDGTIKGTADYKEWLENINKQKEELRARPKPTPGGGISAATSSSPSADEVEEDGQPISSLVAHLRAKKEDAKRKKSQKKKKKDENGKGGKTKTSDPGKSGESGKKKKRRNEKKNGDKQQGEGKADVPSNTSTKKVKRKKRDRGKKNEKGKGAKVAIAPTALLKPKSADA